MGGRVAEQLVYGDLSTGANNDLVGNTELARKMVREWGMSDRIGPMAWGSQGHGLPRRGPDAHPGLLRRDALGSSTKRSSASCVRQEERAVQLLGEHRGGLDNVAAALLEKETIDGLEVKRLVDEAAGRPVRESPVPRFAPDAGPVADPDVDVDDTLVDVPRIV